MATPAAGEAPGLAPVSAHQHRWINTALAVVAGLTAVLTALHDHQVVKLDVVPCEGPARPGTVPTSSHGVQLPSVPAEQ